MNNQIGLTALWLMATAMLSFCLNINAAEQWPRSEDPKTLPYQAMNMSQFIKLEEGYFKALKVADFAELKPFYQHDVLPLTAPGETEEPQKNQMSLLKSKRAYGWGVLAINPAAQQALFLQVPHRFYDKWTAAISAHWWQSGQFKLAMLNTVHRHAGREQDKPINSDFSSAQNNPMLAATRAFIANFKQPVVLQLHGYSKASRNSKTAQKADVILSHGANLPTAYLVKLNKAKACLNRNIAGVVDGIDEGAALVFPHDVTELGGTKNIIGKELRYMGYYQHFVHIELSLVLRQKMRDDNQLSLQVLDCITGPLND
ncbi:MAG: hypothetical protein ACI8WB_001042 [Phenylobacterium sp.]|jgi:hypothetical protein